MSVVYKATYKDYVYIGCTKKTLNLRVNSHRHDFKSKTKNSVFDILGDIDFNDINFKTIQKCKNKDEALNYELCEIAALKALELNVLNKVSGGAMKNRASETTRYGWDNYREKYVNSARNKKLSENHKESIKNGVMKKFSTMVNRYDCIDKKTKEVVYKNKSRLELSKLLKVNRHSIGRYAKGQRNHKEYIVREVYDGGSRRFSSFSH
jgi:hypothetical protein